MQPRIVDDFVIAATIGLLVAGCAADGPGMTETGQGAIIGSTAGAALGAIIGSQHGDAGPGALAGALGGAFLGGMVGAYMEQQRKDFEQALAPEIASGVIRVERLPNDQLLVGMTGETTFAVDSDQINPGFHSTMDRIAKIVNQYGKTALIVAGHTDDKGSASHNQQLSERRAASVERYLENRHVVPERITATGYGMSQPIASNDTDDGRRLNRRVDITIVPHTAGS